MIGEPYNQTTRIFQTKEYRTQYDLKATSKIQNNHGKQRTFETVTYSIFVKATEPTNQTGHEDLKRTTPIEK